MANLRRDGLGHAGEKDAHWAQGIEGLARGLVAVARVFKDAAVIVEQPNVWLFAFVTLPHTHLFPPFYGDRASKTFNLISRGVTFPPGDLHAKGDWTRKRRSDFADGDEADRWRSSWSHYPMMVAQLAANIRLDGYTEQPDFRKLAFDFASAWHAEGLPVPVAWFTAQYTAAVDTLHLLWTACARSAPPMAAGVYLR